MEDKDNTHTLPLSWLKIKAAAVIFATVAIPLLVAVRQAEMMAQSEARAA